MKHKRLSAKEYADRNLIICIERSMERMTLAQIGARNGDIGRERVRQIIKFGKAGMLRRIGVPLIGRGLKPKVCPYFVFALKALADK